jgi:hypothetical protein
MHIIDDWIYFSCVLHILMMLDWLTLHWLMDNLGWIIFGLLSSLVVLFLFPLLLGLQLKNETKNNKNMK